MNKKTVRAVIEKGANYLFHLLSVAKIGLDNNYSQVYSKSVISEDIKFLKQNEYLLIHNNERDSLLNWIYIFFPSMLNLKTQNQINEYFILLSDSIKHKDLQKFELKYSNELKSTTKLAGDIWNCNVKQNLESEDFCLINEAIEISNIIMRNFSKYESDVWSVESKKLDETAKFLNKKLDNFNLIGKLEDLMNSAYLDQEFQVVLCSSNQDGVDAIDLDYLKNLHYFGRQPKELIHFICHEIAIRIVIPFRNKMYSKVEEVDYLQMYKTNEMLAEFYTTQVLDDDLVFNWFPEYLDLIKSKFEENSKLNIEQLFDTCYFGIEVKE